MNKKTLLLSFMASIMASIMAFHQPIMPSSEIKDEIKLASKRAFWGWTKSRSIPVMATAPLIILPAIPMIGMIAGFLGGLNIFAHAGTGISENQENLFAITSLIAAASHSLYSSSYWKWLSLSASLGASLLIKRQIFLTGRDMYLYHKFTNSAAMLNKQNLPPVNEIAKMNNHHQLLNMTKRYLDKEGNLLEQHLLSIPGLKGYKPTPVK